MTEKKYFGLGEMQLSRSSFVKFRYNAETKKIESLEEPFSSKWKECYSGKKFETLAQAREAHKRALLGDDYAD